MEAGPVGRFFKSKNTSRLRAAEATGVWPQSLWKFMRGCDLHVGKDRRAKLAAHLAETSGKPYSVQQLARERQRVIAAVQREKLQEATA